MGGGAEGQRELGKEGVGDVERVREGGGGGCGEG